MLVADLDVMIVTEDGELTHGARAARWWIRPTRSSLVSLCCRAPRRLRVVLGARSGKLHIDFGLYENRGSLRVAEGIARLHACGHRRVVAPLSVPAMDPEMIPEDGASPPSIGRDG